MTKDKDALIFTDEDTLQSLSFCQQEILYPFSKKEDSFRGGMFWCIPNFDTYDTLFSLRHGEYRKTRGALFGETRTKDIAGTWGSLRTESLWKKSETALETSIFIESKKDETYVRPGVHPYFLSTNLVKIIHGTDALSPTEHNFSHLVATNTESSNFTLIYRTHSLRISWNTKSVTPFDTSLVFWTDNPSEYFCVELCFGRRTTGSNLPLPISLKKGDFLYINYKIELNLLEP